MSPTIIEGLISFQEIADARSLAVGTIRRLAAGKDWPPLERRIGNVKFFAESAVDLYFETRVTHHGPRSRGRSRK
jgi:hypothetical protein